LPAAKASQLIGKSDCFFSQNVMPMLFGKGRAWYHICERIPKGGNMSANYSNNRHRMDYPTYRQKGYQIGSGTVESGCKQIVSHRLKVAGAIWNKDNAVKPAKARAALLSDQWDAITSRREFLALPLAV